MNSKLLNRWINHARGLISAARFNLALLLLPLLAATAQAQIAIQDGTPLAALASSGGGPTVNKAFTVTPGAKVMVVIVESRQGATYLAEPATITWNTTNTLTQVTNSQAAPSNYRSMAIYHLYNPPAGTGNITVTYAAAGNTIVITAFTLNGVDTSIAPLILETNSAGLTTYTILSGTATGATAGSWAAFGSVWGNTTALTTVADSVKVTSTALGSSSMIAGYVTNLSGTVTIGVTNGAATKGCFAAVIYAPALPAPPTISAQPQNLNVFTNGTVRFTVAAFGASPLSYQWYTNSTTSALSDTGNRTGSTSNVLTISSATLANAGDYTVVVTNVLGAVTSTVANLTFTSPSGAYETAVMTNVPAPFAFYPLNETSDPSAGSVVVQDFASGAFNGTYGTASSNAFNSISGPRSTADTLIGFPDGNTALLTVSNLANSYVTLPAFNLNNGVGTNVLTITAWVKPQTIQANNTGIVFCRGGSTICGLDYNSINGHLGYTWNDEIATYQWDSGITPPTNLWSLVALVITPTNNTVYIFNTNGLLSATRAYTHVIKKFDAPTSIGRDGLNANRTFDGSIDEVALFGQALTQNQLVTLYSAASGVSVFPPSIAVNPSWAPASVYVGQNSSITVSAGGTAPLAYQWRAGVTNSGIYTDLVNGGNITGVANATLAITNAQLTNLLDYVVVVSNAYGIVTSTVPAKLTVIPAGPATNFTLNFGGNPIQQGIGGDWNTVNAWNPLGLSASTAAIFANPGSSFEIVVGSRMRNPQATTFNVFPGESLIVSGNGGMENGTVTAIGEIRFKNTALSVTTNYFKNLVLSGGQLNIGDSTDVVLEGRLTVVSNSTLQTLAPTGTNQTYRVDSYLTGSGTVSLYLSNSNTAVSLPPASLNITGNTNTFTGKWNIVQGPLVGSGLNSLGTNIITVGTNGILETAYPINNPNSWLVLNGNGQVFLTQNDTFQLLLINGVAVPPGTYPAATLSATYPANFPATFPAVSGTAATTASGQITVLADSIPVGITTQPASIRAITNTTATFSVGAAGYPLNYQWYSIIGGATNALTDATNSSYTTAAVLDADSGTGYFVVVSNQINTVTSSTAFLTAGHMVISAGYLRNDQYFGLTPGVAILTSQLYPGSAWVAANAPSKTEYLSKFESSQDLPGNAGQRIYGWFTPPASGDYVFFSTSDDGSALWLSTNNSPANVYQIAQVQGYMIARDWTCASTGAGEFAYFGTGEWRSDQFELGGGLNAFANFIFGWSQYPGFNAGNGGIPLVAGTPYYVEMDNYQGGGSQNATVTYKLAGNADPSSNSVSLFVGNNISTSVPDTMLPQPKPVISSITKSVSNVILSGTNGLVNAVYNVLSSTNLTTPLVNWTVTTTRVFDANGNFTTTNAIVPGARQTFYRLQQLQ